MDQTGFTNSPGFLLHETAHLLARILDRRLQPLGFSSAQWRALASLKARPGISQTDLAARLQVGKPTVARLIDRMEQHGWVTRKPDPADRRVKRLHLTRRAGPLIEEIERQALQVRQAVFGPLEPEIYDQLIATLAELRTRCCEMLEGEELATGPLPAPARRCGGAGEAG